MAVSLADAFRDCTGAVLHHLLHQRLAVPAAENKRIAHALNAVAAKVSFVEIKTDKGHDAFLLDEPEMFDTVRGFLNSVAHAEGLA